MTFINESHDDCHIQLASAKQTEDILSDEASINRLIDKLDEKMMNHKLQRTIASSSMNEQVISTSTPQKVLKRTPPVMDSKLRISCSAGSYPIDRSADIC